MSTTQRRTDRPGRKRAYKPRLPGAERQALVLRVALKVFAESGYELTSMGTIATEAGITRPVLYHYFPSKQALYLALLEQQSTAMAGYITAHVAAQPNPASRIRAAAEAYLGFAEDHPHAWALLLDDSALTDDACAAGRRQVHDVILTAGLSALAADIDAAGHTATPTETQIGMRFVISGLNGIIQWWREHPDTTRTQIMDTLTATIRTLGTLTTRPAPHDPTADNQQQDQTLPTP